MYSYVDKQEFGLRIVVSCWAHHRVNILLLWKGQLWRRYCACPITGSAVLRLNVHGQPNPSPGMTVHGVSSIQQTLQCSVGTCLGKKRGQLLSTPSAAAPALSWCAPRSTALRHHTGWHTICLLPFWSPSFLFCSCMDNFLPYNTHDLLFWHRKRRLLKQKQRGWVERAMQTNVDLKFKLSRTRMGMFTFSSSEDMLGEDKAKGLAFLQTHTHSC